MPDQELVRLTAAARAGSSRRDAIAAAGGVQGYKDIAGVVSLACWEGSETGAALLSGSAPVLPAHADRQPQPVSCAALGLHRVRAAGHRPRAGWPARPCRARPRAGLRPAGCRRGGAPHAAGAADRAFGGPGRGRGGTGWRSGSPVTARGAAGTVTSIITSRPSAGTGAPRSATTATPACTRTSRSPSGTSRLARHLTGSPSR